MPKNANFSNKFDILDRDAPREFVRRSSPRPFFYTPSPSPTPRIAQPRLAAPSVSNYGLVCLLEGTIVDLHETYGFLLVEANAGPNVHDLSENNNGRLFFNLSSKLSKDEQLKINDLITFSLKIFNYHPGAGEGQIKYEVVDIAVRFHRTDEQIYGSSLDQPEKPNGSGASTKGTKIAKPKLTIAGMIISCNLSKQFCFVRPQVKLPEGVFKPDNFFLHLSNLAALGLTLVFGDHVQIVVNPNHAEKMRADRGVLTSLTLKGHSEVNKVVHETFTFLIRSDHDETFLASQLYETKPIIALLEYLLSVSKFSRSEYMTPLFTIMKVLSFILARMSHQFSKEVLESLTNNGLFDRNGLMSKFISSSSDPILALGGQFRNTYRLSHHRVSPFDSNELFQLLLNCVETFPECSRKIHNLISSKLSLCGPEILLGFMRVLSQPYAKREDTTHRELKLVPTNEELQKFLLSEADHLNLSNLRPVLEYGPYESAEGYIETYFNLLRYDCFYNFLVGLKKFVKGDHDVRDINVYKNGSLLGIVLEKQSATLTFTIACTLESKKRLTNVDKKKMEDDLKKCFLYGNLVAVFSTESSLTDPIWTTVNQKDSITDGRLSVRLNFSRAANSNTFIDCLQQLVQNSGNFLLIESPTHYQSYWPVLKALQGLQSENLPFKEELVNGRAKDAGPLWLECLPSQLSRTSDESDDEKNIDCDETLNESFGRYGVRSARSSFSSIGVERLFDLEQPKVQLTGITLDSSQNDALVHVFQRRVSIIQGPPGTGKTFLGVQVVKRLLEKHSRSINGPMLVLTYKNHALDEFSKNIIREIDGLGMYSFIRVGGQSKDEHMKQYSLRNALGESTKLEYSLLQNLDNLSDSFLTECENFEKRCKVLDLGALKRNMSVAQIANVLDSFVAESQTWQKTFQKLKKEFGSVSNMADALYKLLDKREHRPGIEDLERLYTDALHNWLPNDQFISKLLETERRKELIELQKLFVKSTEAVTVKSEVVENTEEETGEVDLEDMRKVAEQRQELASVGVSHSLGIGQALTFEDDKDFEDSPLCIKHHGSITKIFAPRVDVSDFKLFINIFSMSLLERFQFLQAMLVKQNEVASSKLKSCFEEFEANAIQAQRVAASSEVEALRNAKVVAMTITGAAIRNEVLNTVKPPVIIVEEAAEISEAHLLALLGSHVQQLILIGDHKQLRPQVECYNLVKKYHFDISMMERLINNKLPFATLAYQNRMRPDISKYLKDIYPELKDSKRVLQNPEVKGLQKNFYFWNHQNFEIKGRSPVNAAEAEAAIALAKYLKNFMGYSWDKITILSGYKGQTALLRRKALDVTSKGERLDVQTIDMFQGDENEIVIVSTTRCNPERRPGFMSILNRRCVAQSRGKSGVYFIGNAETLSDVNSKKKENVWAPLFTTLWKDDCVGDTLGLVCKNHKNSARNIWLGDPFPTNTSVFCTEKCPIMKSCGEHICKNNCQPYHDESHKQCLEIVPFDYKCGKHSTRKKCYVDPESLICRNDCDFKFHTDEDCDLDVHNCTKTCEPLHLHSKCYTKIQFSCDKNGHFLVRDCWQDPKAITCHAKISFVFQFCGVHKGNAQCWENEMKKVCDNPCLKLMDPCKHPCKKICEPSHDHDSLLMKCKFPIKYCCDRCGSRKDRMCYQNDSDVRCENKIPFLFTKCGRHKSVRKCYENPEDQVCPNSCDLPLPSCGHLCKKPCKDDHSHEPDLNRCREIIKFEHRCKKQLKRVCWQTEESISCDGSCVEILKCQHKCHLPCDPKHDHVNNPAIKCNEKVQDLCDKCGNVLSRKCHEEPDSSKCRAEVMFKHSCGFELSRPCNKSEQDVKCTGQCAEMLACGHRCVQECGSKHSHSYLCQETTRFVCKNCLTVLTKKCSQNDDDIRCSGSMTHLCTKCNFRSRGLCPSSKVSFECMLPCEQKLECGHVCFQKCHQDCTKVRCQTCIEGEKEKERIEAQKRQAQKNREIEEKRAEIRKELQNTKRNPSKEVLQYEINPKGDESSPFFEIRDLVLKYLKVQKGYMVKIASVSLISNLWAKRKQTECQLNLIDPCNKKTMCYLTTESERKIEIYANHGFRSSFGKGAANRVCFHTTSNEVVFKSEDFYFYVLVCEVLVGRAKNIQNSKNVNQDKRFDCSYYANDSSFESSKYFIFNADYILVTHVVKFTLEAIKSSAADVKADDWKTGEFQKIRLEPSRSLEMDDHRQYYYRLAESQFLRWSRGNYNSSIESIDLFFNPELEKKFDEKKKEFNLKYTKKEEKEEIFAFHGTPIEDPDVIMKENFRLDLIKAFAHGYGIYFSEFPSTSLGYARTTGNLILARVLLGKSVPAERCSEMSRGQKTICSQHDSHTVKPGKDGYANMVIIQNVDQIFPMFIIRVGNRT